MWRLNLTPRHRRMSVVPTISTPKHAHNVGVRIFRQKLRMKWTRGGNWPILQGLILKNNLG